MATATTTPSLPAQQHSQLVHHLLVPEILGFSPQLLLDDIINIANNAVQDGVNGMEEFFEKWVDARAERKAIADGSDITQEIEQGLVSFQTLLEHHTDIAFDFFEAWSLRNIFAIPPNLPIVVPHQQGLDLTLTQEREQELMDQMEDLRKQLDNQRRLRRILKQAVQISKRHLHRDQNRLSQLSLLESPSLDVLGALPQKLMAMYTVVSTLPPPDPSILLSLSHADHHHHHHHAGKRLWETGVGGYKSWAVEKLVEREEGRRKDGGRGRSVVDAIAENAELVGSAEQLRMAIETMDGVAGDLDSVEHSRVEEMDMEG